MNGRQNIRVVILGNHDMTTDIVMSRLAESHDVSVVAIADTATLAANQGGSRLGQALRLQRKMSRRYWIFLVFTNALFNARQIACRLISATGISCKKISLKDAADARGLVYQEIADFNSREFKEELRKLRPDLIIIRINQILDAEFLEIPKYATWCLHSSILPSYGGYAAEFHALRNDEKTIGSTLFNVDQTIDGGRPLYQSRFASKPGRSLFAHLMYNNLMAADLVLDSVLAFAGKGNLEPSTVSPLPPPSYYRWPQPKDVCAFKERGRNLIESHEILMFLAACLLPVGARKDFIRYFREELRMT